MSAANSKVLGVIPARYASTRFPGKALADLHGQPLIWRVFERARRAEVFDRLVVATDDRRILDAVCSRGGDAVMTRPDHRSGTERVAEVAAGCDCGIAVNLQGDEPLLDPRDIAAGVRMLRESSALHAATLYAPLGFARDLFNPHLVKLLIDGGGRALYFSRAPVGSGIQQWQEFMDGRLDPERSLHDYPVKRHVGVYFFRREFLLEFARWPVSPLEKAEGLEQLRILERGECIGAVAVRDPAGAGRGVDVPEDLEEIRRIWYKSDGTMQAGMP